MTEPLSEDDLHTTLVLPAMSAEGERASIEGVVIGKLVGLRDDQPLIVHSGLEQGEQQLASAIRTFSLDDLGAEVAIVFVGADPERPIVLGKLEYPSPRATDPADRHS